MTIPFGKLIYRIEINFPELSASSLLKAFIAGTVWPRHMVIKLSTEGHHH